MIRAGMGTVTDLLERPVYSLVQVDRLLALHTGTARRWLEGYERERFETKYPLATARPFVAGKELVLQVQEKVGLEKALAMVVVRSGQLLLTPPVEQFLRAVEFTAPMEGIVLRLHPLTGNPIVVVDPLRQFGEPVVRSVPTEVIAEQFAAGDSVELIAELYDLSRHEVEAALRYEHERAKAQAPTAA